MFVTMYEKPLLEYIRRGGTLTDPRGMQHVAQFVRKASKGKHIQAILDRYHFDIEDLCQIYAVMIQSLMPNPCIECGGNMLAATLPFAEPERLDVMISQMTHDLSPALGSQRRKEIISRHAAAHAQAIWQSHAAAKGLPKFRITPDGKGGHTAPSGSGCFTAAAILIVLAVCMFSN
ncbi:MAG: hypothetical protein HYV27_02830 [Candidatus Hydrogenedentes bacterium]|nr:hypothetical protein [Candidatus Hydrogenedentota bacterium]